MNRFLLCVGLVVILGGCDRLSVQKQLEKYVADQKENSPLPRRISDRQTLVDIQAGDKELIQVFKVKGSKKKIRESTDELEQDVLVELRKKKAQIENLIQFKIVMTFKFLHNASGELLHEFQVKPWQDL